MLNAFLGMFVLQPQSSYHTMPKKGKKKAKVTGEDPDVEILPRMEIIYEETKAVTGADQEFKWGEIYQMIKDQAVLDAGLEDIALYVNIRNSAIAKVATRPELFPCVEVIDWIFPKTNARDMIMYNVEEKGFTSFTPTYIAQA